MVRFRQRLKLMSRYEFQQLRKHGAMVGQGLDPPTNTVCWCYFTVCQFEDTKPFLFLFMGHQ